MAPNTDICKRSLSLTEIRSLWKARRRNNAMKLPFAALLLTATLAFSQGHPDLSGTWTFGIDLPPGDLVKVVDGKVTRTHWDGSIRHSANEIPGALAWEKAPSYRPEFQEKVKYLAANESKTDPVF